MAQARTKAISTIRREVVALQQVTRGDLASPEAVESLVKAAAEVNDAAKQYADEKAKVVAKAKALYAPEVEEGRKVTLYGFESGKKVSISFSGGGVEVDDEGVFAAICEAAGCSPDDPTKSALDTWESVTRPQPRVLDERLLADAMRDSPRLRSIVEANTTVKRPSVRATIGNMTKGEVKDHESGELTDNVVIG